MVSACACVNYPVLVLCFLEETGPGERDSWKLLALTLGPLVSGNLQQNSQPPLLTRCWRFLAIAETQLHCAREIVTPAFSPRAVRMYEIKEC